MTNGPTFDSANRGSIVFDGSNDYVIIPTAPTSLVTNQGAATISVWVYPHVTGQRMIFGNGDTSRFYVETFGSVFHWGFGGNNNSTTSQATFSINKWYNYVASYDGANVRGYLNSRLTDTTSVSPSYGGSELKIGNWQNNLYFNGNISNVSVYNRALTGDEVRQNYEATVGDFHEFITFPQNSYRWTCVVPRCGEPRSYPKSGTTWSDLVDNNIGTLYNSPEFSNDSRGCLVFDGTNEYAAFSSSDLINSATGATQPRSVCIWTKYTASANLVILEKGTNKHFVLQTRPDGSMQWRVSGSSSNIAVSSTSLNDNNWRYFVFTYGSDRRARVYTDGIF